jgi:alcohol dehydrogenase (cytochrome c)
VKGRMYALDSTSGKILWEFYLVPRGDAPKSSALPEDAAGDAKSMPSWGNAADVPITGGATWTSYSLDRDHGLLYVPGGNPAPDFVPSLRPGDNLFTDSIVVLDAKTGVYKAHYQIVRNDFHDWDVSTAPALLTTRGGRQLMAIAPKDGHLYGYDLASGKQIYATPTTTISNASTPLTTAGTRFCPGTQGGSEWNGAAYSPASNLIFVGATDWCSTVRVADPAKAKNASVGQPWSGSGDEKNLFGTLDPKEQWAGWLSAIDADSGKLKWKYKAATPLVSGVTPTAGGLVFFGDINGGVFALDAQNGKRLWTQTVDGAIGGGVIAYQVGGRQRIAVAAGMTSAIWPTAKTNAKVVVFGLPDEKPIRP